MSAAPTASTPNSTVKPQLPWIHAISGTAVAETGFGTGLNALVTWRAWRESGMRGPLRFVSIERYPFDRDTLGALLAPFRSALDEEIEALLGA